MNRDGNRNYVAPHYLAEDNLTQRELEKAITKILGEQTEPIPARRIRDIIKETCGARIHPIRIAQIIEARFHNVKSKYSGHGREHYKLYWMDGR